MQIETSYIQHAGVSNPCTIGKSLLSQLDEKDPEDRTSDTDLDCERIEEIFTPDFSVYVIGAQQAPKMGMKSQSHQETLRSQSCVPFQHASKQDKLSIDLVSLMHSERHGHTIQLLQSHLNQQARFPPTSSVQQLHNLAHEALSHEMKAQQVSPKLRHHQVATINTYQKQFKRDVLWKPLLRLFRRYLKKDALQKSEYQQIREKPLKDQGYLFAQALGVPEPLARNKRAQFALILLVNSHRVVFRKQLIPQCRRMMQNYIGELMPLFFEIFQDNNYGQRVTFFKEQVIHHLWNRFRNDYAVQYRDYLDTLDSEAVASALGIAEKRKKFIIEVKKMEWQTNCHILPSDL